MCYNVDINKSVNINGVVNMFQVYDTQTKLFTKGEYSTVKRARSKADKLNLAYGAHRYIVKTNNKEV